MIALIVGALFLLVGGSLLIYYVGVYRPNQLHTQATSTGQAIGTGTAAANASATARVGATSTVVARATANTQATATGVVQATATALQAIYTTATSGTPTLNEPLTANTGSNWRVYSDANGSCAFTNGALQANNSALCLAQATGFNDFAFQVKATSLKNGGASGIVFRTDLTAQRAYFFEVTSSGAYAIILVKSGSQQTLTSGLSGAIDSNAGASNLYAVVARGSTISVFINKQFVAQVNDQTAPSGSVGVFTSTTGSAEQVAFNDAQVWTL